MIRLVLRSALSCDYSPGAEEGRFSHQRFADYLFGELQRRVEIVPPSARVPHLFLTSGWRRGRGRPAALALSDLAHVFARGTMGPLVWARRNFQVARSVRLADQLVVPSLEVMHGLERYLAVGAGRVLVMPPRPLEVFRRPRREAVEDLRRQLDLGRPYLVFAGSRSSRKNLELLGRAWRAAAALVGGELDLVLTGGGGGGIAGARDLGWVSDERLALLLAGAVAYVNPSLWEGSAIGAEEAMACGCPPVVAARGALPRAVTGAGLALDATSLADWTQGLVALATRPQLRQELAVGALRHAAETRGLQPPISELLRRLGLEAGQDPR